MVSLPVSMAGGDYAKGRSWQWMDIAECHDADAASDAMLL
jgi:hypothetical protein